MSCPWKALILSCKKEIKDLLRSEKALLSLEQDLTRLRLKVECSKSQGMQTLQFLNLEKTNRSPPNASGASMALLTSAFQTSEADFGLLTSRTVRE